MELEKKISSWITNYLDNTNLSSLIVGVSGGIDSALTSTLCAMSNKKTIVVSIPIFQNESQLNLAKKHIEWLKSNFNNVISIEIDMSDVFSMFEKKFDSCHNLSSANSKSRLRMVTLYHISSLNNGIVVGTGNKVEDFGIGFFTKYGDGGVDISPIADLTKTEVRELASNLGIIEEIIQAEPTDGLWDDDRTDEQQIGATYSELEWAMSFDGNLSDLTEKEIDVLQIYKKFNKMNAHKMTTIPIFKK
jgi:NAD+ synthase